jgi:Ca2+-binding EF-hand superfamily protein
MTRPCLLCVPLSALLFLFAGLSWTGAADPPKGGDPGSAEDVADVILVLEHRPILVRLHITIDNQPYTTHWEKQLRKVFDFLDRDGDGVLDREEALLVPSIDRLHRLFTGDITFGIQQNQNNNMMPPVVFPNIPPRFADMDFDSDGQITFEEFCRFYRHTEAGPLDMVAQNAQSLTANILTDLLFSVLDTDKDGKLSREELLAAEKVLRQFDTNDDELVSAQELLAEAPRKGGQPNMPGLFPGTVLPGKVFPNIPIMLVPREDAARSVTYRMPATKEILAQYDKDQRQKVSADQIGFPKELFGKLDTSKSGTLGPRELARWLIFHPDAEMVVRLGRSPGGDRVQLPLPEDGGAKPPFTPNKTAENALAVALDAIHMSVLRTETQYPQNQGAKAQYLQQFKMLDKQRNGYLKLDQLKLLDKDPNAVTILALFAMADRDGNDKLTEKELTDFLDLMISMHGSQARLTFADNGQSLFELLDANRDGQLSIRELRTAWKRLEEFDRDRKGFITRGQIPRQYQIMVSQQAPFMNPNAQAGANFGVTVVQSLPTRGPLWFRKMDVNNDGDVSEREFLGSREDFKRINTSGDGLISAEEAEKADAWFREKMKK